MRTIACIGDSLTFNNSLGVNPNEFWPHIVANGLKGLGLNVRCRNWGRSGWTTAETLNPIANLLTYEVPHAAIILLGANDVGKTIQVQASPTPTASSFTVTAGQGMYLLPGTYIQWGSDTRQVATRNVDAIALTAPLSGTPATNDNISIATLENLKAIVNYLKVAGTGLFLMVGKPYQNISSNADTVGAENATMAQIRGYQRAAAKALNIPYLDMYSVMKARIQSGLDVQGSASWHVYDNNTHHNAYGESIIGNAVIATIASLPTWMGGLAEA